MNIVYAMTRNVYHWAYPSLRSLWEHNPDAKVYIVCEDDAFPLPEDLSSRKVTTINVTGQQYFPPDTCVNYRNRYTYINLLKVCYADLLPRLNKVIHLDVDTIVCDSLEEFWKTDVRDKWFAAVQEYKGRYKPFGPRYWNMGIALINLQQMRRDEIQPVMVEYLNTVRQPWADQDAWIKFGIERDKIVDLPLRWNENMMTGTTKGPGIVHYCAIGNWYVNRTMKRREFLDKYLK